MGCCKSREKVSITLRTETALQLIRRSSIRTHTNTFKDEYQSGNKIGTGGFAEVRRCTHKHTGGMRAVKIYKKTQFTPEYIAAGGLNQEIEIFRMIDHPNIVKVYECFEDKDNYYITMEFCMGGELFDKIGDFTQLTEYSVCSIMRQLLSAVAYLHDKGIAHRDLKPENILIEDRNEQFYVKLADFGNAVRFSYDTKLRGETGTCYYMAPEVIEGEYTEKCDEWSCGVIMFMLLTGDPPFVGANDEEILQNVKKQEFSVEGTAFSKISSEAKDLIKLLLKPEATRITVIEALAHPWFTVNPKQKNVKQSTITNIYNNLKGYKVSFQLKEAIKSFIIGHILPGKEIKMFREVFSVIDQDNDGKISAGDLSFYLQQTLDPESSEIEANNIVNHIDTNNKGYLEYSEYLTASIDESLIFTRNNLILAFNMLDTDKKGWIDAQNLKLAIGDPDSDLKSWQVALEETGRSATRINMSQFIEMLTYR